MEAIKVTSDVSTAINILNIESSRDIPAGASVQLSYLINGNVIEQGTPLSEPTSGIRNVCKQAVCLTGSTTTVKNVATGKHNFKVGEFLCTKTGGKAYAITDITETSGVDAITVGTAIEANAAGSFIYEAAAEAAATTSTFLNVPTCISAKAFVVDNTKIIEAIPALVGASIKGGVIGSGYLSLLKNIDEINY
jgi:hypothetical protein